MAVVYPMNRYFILDEDFALIFLWLNTKDAKYDCKTGGIMGDEKTKQSKN